MKVNYFDKKGKLNSKTYEIPNDIFGVKVNESLLAQYIYTYLANQRQSNAHTKDRGEVSGGGKKPWNQKGTGRARAGSSRSPLWKGGGVTFGPKNTRNYKSHLSKNMIKAAMKSSFSLLAKNEALSIIEKFDIEKANTKMMVELLKEFNQAKRLILVQNGANIELVKAVRNIPNVSVMNIVELNPYTISGANHIVLIEDALDFVKQTWGKTKKVDVLKAKPEAAVKKVAKAKVEKVKKVTKTSKKTVK